MPIGPNGERLPYPGDGAGLEMAMEQEPPEAPPGAPGPEMAMMDEAPPDPSEVAQMLGAQIAQKREQAHAMVDQAAQMELQQVTGLIMAAAQGGQVLGPGEVA